MPSPKVDRTRPLWQCPKCGKRFVTRNMWHGCDPYTVEQFLEGKGSRARALFHHFTEMMESIGPYVMSPNRTTGIAFMVRVRFGGVRTLSDRGMTIAFALPYEVHHPRIHKIEVYTSGWFGHIMRITAPEEMDDQVREWLRASYHLMGEQMRFAEAHP